MSGRVVQCSVGGCPHDGGNTLQLRGIPALSSHCWSVQTFIAFPPPLPPSPSPPSQENACNAATPQVCLLLLTLLDPREKCTALQALATKVVVKAVHVLHNSLPVEVRGQSPSDVGQRSSHISGLVLFEPLLCLYSPSNRRTWTVV